MLTKKFSQALQFNNVKADVGSSKYEPVKWRVFKKSLRTKQKIKEAGLENEIDDSVEVEANYKLRKIVGYGATSTVFKAHKYDRVEDATGSFIVDGVIELEE